jgi:aquaporin Z
VGIGLSFGLVVLALIYAIGDISGAHMNPAVTIAFFVSGRFHKKNLAPYLTAQISGGIMASILLKFMFLEEKHNYGLTLPRRGDMQSFILEVLLTFFLMLVIMGVATGAKEKGILAGIAIGATVALEAIWAGPISGASMNPARSIGPAIVSGNFNSLWLYILAPIVGAVLAVFTFAILNKEGVCE